MIGQVERAEVSAYLREAQDTKWVYAAVRARFEAEAAQTYGSGMSTWIPGYAETHELMLDALSFYLPAAGRVLDLGAGTGRFSKRILQAFDECHITLVDFSANMLGEAATQLSTFAGRYDLRPGDFFEPEVDFPEGAFDCIISVFAICHGRDVRQYQHLYEKIQRWLRPGGCFLCYDHVLGDHPLFTVLNVAGWQKFLELSQPKESVREGIVSTYQEDSPLSLRQHLALLSQAGFRAVDVLWKKDIFAIYAGVKL